MFKNNIQTLRKLVIRGINVSSSTCSFYHSTETQLIIVFLVVMLRTFRSGWFIDLRYSCSRLVEILNSRADNNFVLCLLNFMVYLEGVQWHHLQKQREADKFVVVDNISLNTFNWIKSRSKFKNLDWFFWCMSSFENFYCNWLEFLA